MIEMLEVSDELVLDLDEVKLALRVDTSDTDLEIERLIKAATDRFESSTQYHVAQKSFVMTLDAWPIDRQVDWFDGMRMGAINNDLAKDIKIPVRPFNEINKIEIANEAGEFIEMQQGDYLGAKSMDGGLLCFNEVTRPTPKIKRSGIKITFTVGYATRALIPYAIKDAILQLVEHSFEKTDEKTPLPKAYLKAVENYKKIRL